MVFADILRDKTMNDKLMYIPNDYKLIYSLCRLQLLDTASFKQPILS